MNIHTNETYYINNKIQSKSSEKFGNTFTELDGSRIAGDRHPAENRSIQKQT
jgi:hypothetical protein